MKILIVDDSAAMRKIVQRTLRQAGLSGHDIIEAENGKAGLESVHANKPDLILSDWNMPEMTGEEFCTALRGEGDETPFGFITTEGSAAMRQRATDAGAQFLLAKPFTPDEVSATLGKYI